MQIANKIIGNIIGKPRVRGGRKDKDGDGVSNKKDCQPRNTMRQDYVVNTGGAKQFVYPINQELEDTESTAKFKKSYKEWQLSK